VSTTRRTAFIRQQLVQDVLVHALRRSVFARALRGRKQAFARDALRALVARRGNDHDRGAAVPRDADRLALRSLENFAESGLGFEGGDALHAGQNSYSGRYRQGCRRLMPVLFARGKCMSKPAMAGFARESTSACSMQNCVAESCSLRHAGRPDRLCQRRFS
jgi:hypothetical protein